MGYNEGDYIRTVDGLFFAVKGSRHSDELVVGVLRYIPDSDGSRALGGVKYSRIYDLNLSTDYLLSNYPSYINNIPWLGIETQSIPASKIEKVYDPREKLKTIFDNPETLLEKRIKRFVSILSKMSNLDADVFGLSGSILIGLETEDSDIDLNIYGEKEGRKVYQVLGFARKSLDWVSGYDENSIEPVLFSRWGDTGLNLEQFREIECQKLLHGMVDDVDYFIRLLKEEPETASIPIKKLTMDAVISDSSESIFTPCTYLIKPDSTHKITELKSYRGKFTEQAHEGDKVKLRGTLEKVTQDGEIFYRIILGGPGDYLVPIDL